MHYCKEKKGLFITNNAKMSRWFFDTTQRKMREKKCDDNVKMGRILLKGQHFSVQFFIRSCCFNLNLLWNIQETWWIRWRSGFQKLVRFNRRYKKASLIRLPIRFKPWWIAPIIRLMLIDCLTKMRLNPKMEVINDSVSTCRYF